MEIVVIGRGPRPGLYYVAAAPPRCGQITVKLMELPTNAEPPFKADLLKTRRGTALLNTTPLDLDEWLLEHLDQLIEGEVKDGVLEGVVCNKKLQVKVLDPSVSGPVFAVVPVARRKKTPPPLVLTLLAYKIQIAG
ncbi:MAG: hypothetical protein ACO2PM_20195 [Pyrobaculum sp.]|jgi:hypothetical protein|nr:MAG: hypothetical protein AT708_01765 [Pyrobaculum sp. OCT_11]